MGKFDWIAVKLTSSGTGKPFGAPDRIGALVIFGLRIADSVREIGIPVLLEAGAKLTVSDARELALKQATLTLRSLLDDINGQTYEDLASRQNIQDDEREKELERSLTLSLI